MATAKKTAETVEEKVETAEVVTHEKEYRTYKVIEDRNFNGFVHPKTRKFVTQNKGVIKVEVTDQLAIAILDAAADVTDVTDIVK